MAWFRTVVEDESFGDEGPWIVRVYESKQYRSEHVTLRFGRPIRRPARCNLIEEEEEAIALEDRSVSFAVRPYEIKTFKVWLA